MWCANCKKPCDTRLCSDCKAALAGISFDQCYELRCEVCGNPIMDHCYPCPWCTEDLLAYGPYEGVLASLVLRYKSGGELFLAFLLADLFQYMIEFDDSSVLVPIPASLEGKRRRGFDQMLLVARILSARTGAHVVRLFTHHTKGRHALLSKKARLVKAPLREKRGVKPKDRGYLGECKHVYVLDDIHTTGATCAFAKAHLEQTYHASVKIVVLCKA